MEEKDLNIWEEILHLQLEGVMYHTSLAEECNLNELDGFSCLHFHQAEEEFENYLKTLKLYLNTFKKIPENQQFSAPVIKLDGTTREEKMIESIELYRSWENGVLLKLQNAGDDFLHLKQDVRDELKCINLIMNDLLDDKYEELNNFLIKKWGD